MHWDNKTKSTIVSNVCYTGTYHHTNWKEMVTIHKVEYVGFCVHHWFSSPWSLILRIPRNRVPSITMLHGSCAQPRIYILFVFTHIYFFWTSRGHRCRPFFPPVVLPLILQFLSRIGFRNSSARRFFMECGQLARSRFPQLKLCTKKSPHEFTWVCTWGIRTHETDLYQARWYPDTPPGRW